MKIHAILIAGTAIVALGGVAHAQSASTSRTMPSPATTQPSGSPSGVAPPASSQTAPATAPAQTAPAQPSLTRMDAYFVQQAASSGLNEVEEAKIAQQQSSNAQVKQFAQTMIDDHTKANDQLKQIAAQKGVELPAAPVSGEEESQQLQKLKGAAFDRRYAAQEVKDHEDAVKLFQDEQKTGNDTDLKQFASNTLPILQQHLDMAKQLNSEASGSATATSKHHKAKAGSGSSSPD